MGDLADSLFCPNGTTLLLALTQTPTPDPPENRSKSRFASTVRVTLIEVLSTSFFPCKGVAGYEVGSKQFVGHVHVPPVVDFFDKAAHQGFVNLFDRHRSFLLGTPTRPPPPGDTMSMMPLEGVWRTARSLIYPSA
jgi:hypothetical protein